MVLDDASKPINRLNKGDNWKIAQTIDPYSLNLAPSYFYLYSLLKKKSWKHYEVRRWWKDSTFNPNVADTVNKKFHAPCIETLIKWWAKRIHISGEYVEK